MTSRLDELTRKQKSLKKFIAQINFSNDRKVGSFNSTISSIYSDDGIFRKKRGGSRERNLNYNESDGSSFEKNDTDAVCQGPQVVPRKPKRRRWSPASYSRSASADRCLAWPRRPRTSSRASRHRPSGPAHSCPSAVSPSSYTSLPRSRGPA